MLAYLGLHAFSYAVETSTLVVTSSFRHLDQVTIQMCTRACSGLAACSLHIRPKPTNLLESAGWYMLMIGSVVRGCSTIVAARKWLFLLPSPWGPERVTLNLELWAFPLTFLLLLDRMAVTTYLPVGLATQADS